MADEITKYSSINDDQEVPKYTAGKWESATHSDQYKAIAIK